MPKTKVAAIANAANASKLKASKIPAKAKASKAIKKTGPTAGGVKTAEVKERKKGRFKAGTVALREIKRYQKSNDLLLPRAPFMRLVKSIAEGEDHQMRFQSQAI